MTGYFTRRKGKHTIMFPFFSQVTSKKKNFYQECNIIDDTDLRRGSDLQFSKCGAPSYDQYFLLSFAHLFLSGKVRSRRLSAKAALYDPSTSTPHPHPQHIWKRIGIIFVFIFHSSELRLKISKPFRGTTWISPITTGSWLLATGIVSQLTVEGEAATVLCKDEGNCLTIGCTHQW